MFKCGFCKKSSSGKPVNRVVETRPKTYDLGGGKESRGSEIVREVKACLECAF